MSSIHKIQCVIIPAISEHTCYSILQQLRVIFFASTSKRVVTPFRHFQVILKMSNTEAANFCSQRTSESIHQRNTAYDRFERFPSGNEPLCVLLILISPVKSKDRRNRVQMNDFKDMKFKLQLSKTHYTHLEHR